MANTSAIWQRAAHTTYQLPSPTCSTGVISRGLTANKNLRVFLEKVIRMDYQKNYQIQRAKGLCRKTGFLHSNNSCFISFYEWIYLLKVNLKTSQESLNNQINHYFSFKGLMTIPFRHLTGQSIGWRELGSSPPCSACLECLAWVAPGACWKERSTKPHDIHQDPIHPHLSRWVPWRWSIIFWCHSESLGVLLEGATEPLDAILWDWRNP